MGNRLENWNEKIHDCEEKIFLETESGEEKDSQEDFLSRGKKGCWNI